MIGDLLFFNLVIFYYKSDKWCQSRFYKINDNVNNLYVRNRFNKIIILIKDNKNDKIRKNDKDEKAVQYK